jgi:hypothetical protein
LVTTQEFWIIDEYIISVRVLDVKRELRSVACLGGGNRLRAARR